MRLGRLLGAALGGAIGFLAAPATGGASLAIAAGALGALSGGGIGSNIDEERRNSRSARAIASEQVAENRRQQELFATQRARIEEQTARERARVNASLARSTRGRFRSGGFLGSASVTGTSEVLG